MRVIIQRGMGWAFAVGLAVCSGWSAASAQTRSQNWANCQAQGTVAPDIQISNCTAVIQSGQETAKNLAGAYYNRGNAYYSQNDLSHALADYGSAIQLDGQFAKAYYGRGNVYRDQGDCARAIVDYDQAILLNSQSASAFYNRGVCNSALGNYARAIPDYNEAIRLNPQHAGAYTNRGDAFNHLADYVHAIADFGSAIRLDPQMDLAFVKRAIAYESQGDSARAIPDYDSASQINPSNASYQNGRCWTRAVTGSDLDIARAACDRSLQLAPNNADTLDSRGMVGLKQKRWQDAWNDYDAAVRLAAKNPSPRFGRGVAALNLGRTAEGNLDIAAAVKLEGNIVKIYEGFGVKLVPVETNTGVFDAAVFFDWNQSRLTPEGNRALDEIVVKVARCTDIKLAKLVGHDDTSQSSEDAMTLSQRRVSVVRDGLVSRGVPAGVLWLRALGDTELPVPTADGVNEQKNRSVEIHIECA